MPMSMQGGMVFEPDDLPTVRSWWPEAVEPLLAINNNGLDRLKQYQREHSPAERWQKRKAKQTEEFKLRRKEYFRQYYLKRKASRGAPSGTPDLPASV